MVNGISFVLLSICIYLPIVLFQSQKKMELKSRITFFVIYFLFAFIASELFFPLPVQRAIVEQEAYYKQLQTIIPFYELYYVFSKVAVTQTDALRILGIYVHTTVAPAWFMGIMLGFALHLKIKTVKNTLIINAFCCVLIEVCKYVLCLITGAKYLQITPDNALYAFLGSICGCLLLKLVRNLLKGQKYHSAFFNALRDAIVNDK